MANIRGSHCGTPSASVSAPNSACGPGGTTSTSVRTSRPNSSNSASCGGCWSSMRAIWSITGALPGKASRSACRVSASSAGGVIGRAAVAGVRAKSGIGWSGNSMDGQMTPTYPIFALGARRGIGAKKRL